MTTTKKKYGKRGQGWWSLKINWKPENHLTIWVIINIKRLFTYLSVCVFNGGNVRIIKRSIDESQNKTSLAYSPSSKSHHTIVIALFWHYLTILGGKKTGDKFNNNFFLDDSIKKKSIWKYGFFFFWSFFLYFWSKADCM